MKKPRIYHRKPFYRLTLLISAVCALVLLISPFWPARHIQADTPPLKDNSYIRIDYPKNGDNFNNPSINIAVSYLWDMNWYDPPSPTNKWGWDINCRLYQTFDSSNPNDFSEFESNGDVTSTSGGGSLAIDLSAYPPGRYQITAYLMGPGYGTSHLVAWISAASAFSYKSGGAVSPSTETPSNNSGGAPVGPIIGVAAVIGVIGLIVRAVTKGRKSVPVKTPPKTAPPKSTPPRDNSSKSIPPPQNSPPKGKDTRSKELIEADRKYAEALKSKKAFDRYSQLRHAVYNDDRLVGFVDDAQKSIIGADGLVDESKLNKLEGTLKNWIKRDMNETPGYTTANAYSDTFDGWQGFTHNLPVRIALGLASSGTSELVLMPVSSVSTMGQSLAQGKSTTSAIADGLMQTTTEVISGEIIGQGIKFASPYVKNAYSGLKEGYNLSKLAKVNPDLASEVSTINQLANQTEGQVSRNTFMKSTEVAQLGKTPDYQLTSLEKNALELNNNPEFRDLLAKKSDLVPQNVKEVFGTAKQKVFQQARNNAIGDTVEQMGKDGNYTGENPLFIKQTGTHAQAGNPGWNSLKSDFDHTVDFGDPKYNQAYENSFNTHLENMGTSSKAIDANIYGEGTSSRGAYTGSGSMKFVENYNQTTGSDVMIRSDNGVVTVSQETPQTSTSLLSKMNPDDVNNAGDNFKTFFGKDMAKGGSLENQITNGSKTVSRMNKINYVKNFQDTGQVSNFQAPPAAKVADLIKNNGYSVNDAMNKVGYGGDKSQLLNDFKKIME